MNIVLVVFDSMRKDCIGAYGRPPWWRVHTPNLDALAAESLVMDRAYPESLPTLPTRRALYTGQPCYPFHEGVIRLHGDFVGATGWGPIPESQPTLAEMLKEAGYRTGLIADVYHMFKPSKNFWRGFDQWMFLRGQERDMYRSGPVPSAREIRHWLPKEMETPGRREFITKCLMNMHDRTREEDWFNARVFQEAAVWLQQNQDAEQFFLTVESFDPHEPWFVPRQYRRMYDTDEKAREQVVSGYRDVSDLDPKLLNRTRANYSGLVTMCDRWFGHFYEQMRTLGLLENTLLIVTCDHGHSIGDGDYLGKRGYPSHPSVFDVPLFVRHPKGRGAGKRSRLLVQHTDISAEILKTAGVRPPQRLHGKPFFSRAVSANGKPIRDHVTVGWSSGVTVITEKWWLNCKANGRGAFLHDLKAAGDPFAKNLADKHPKVVKQLFAKALADAGGQFPDGILEMAEQAYDAPGCSDLAAGE